MTERDIIFNYCALLEVIFSPEEVLPDRVLYKYGLLDLSEDDLKRLEAEEMWRLRREKGLTYLKIAELYGLTDSGVYRRIKRWEREIGISSSCAK